MVANLTDRTSSMRNKCYDKNQLRDDFDNIRLIFSVLTDDEQQRFINYFRHLLVQEKATMPPASS